MSTNNTNLPSGDVAAVSTLTQPSETGSGTPSSGAGEFTEQEAAGVFSEEERSVPVEEKKPSILKSKVHFEPLPEGKDVEEDEYEVTRIPFSETESTKGSEAPSEKEPVILQHLKPIAHLKLGVDSQPVVEEKNVYADDEYEQHVRPLGGNYGQDKRAAKELKVDNPTKKNVGSESKTRASVARAPLGTGDVRGSYFIGDEVDYSIYEIEVSAGVLRSGPVPITNRPMVPKVTELVGQVDYEAFPLIARVEVKGGRVPVVTQKLNDLFVDKKTKQHAPVASGVVQVTDFSL
jgi:hypothetical protein